jgi:hypothetical protein
MTDRTDELNRRKHTTALYVEGEPITWLFPPTLIELLRGDRLQNRNEIKSVTFFEKEALYVGGA